MKKATLFIIAALSAAFLGACNSPEDIAANATPQNTPVQEITIKQEEQDLRLLNVRGKGQVQVTPDIAAVHIGVTNTASTVEEAQALNSAAMEQVKAAIIAKGIPEKDIQTDNYNIHPEYDYKAEKSELVGYTVSNRLHIKVRKLDVLGELLSDVAAAGANMIYGIEYGLDDSGTAYQSALKAAVEDASKKAQAIAEAANIKLNLERPAAITEESQSYSPVIYAENEAVAEADGSVKVPVPVSRGELNVTAEISVEYEILKNEQ